MADLDQGERSALLHEIGTLRGELAEAKRIAEEAKKEIERLRGMLEGRQ